MASIDDARMDRLSRCASTARASARWFVTPQRLNCPSADTSAFSRTDRVPNRPSLSRSADRYTTPACSAASGRPGLSGTPRRSARPVARPSPASARRNSLCPLPTIPASPTISPADAVSVTSWKARAEKFCTASTGASAVPAAAPWRLPAAALAGNSALTARPTMSSRSWASETSWTPNVPRTLPSRSTVTRWQSSRTSASRCVMYTTATPLAAIRRSSANRVAESSAPEGGGGLVQDQHRRIGGQRLGHLEQMPLGHGEVAHPLAEASPAADPGQL